MSPLFHLFNSHYLSFVSQSNQSNHTCVFWDSSDEGGTWSPRGCSVVKSNPEYTVCSCNHLSSFAVLMALHDIEVKTHDETWQIMWLIIQSLLLKLRPISV